MASILKWCDRTALQRVQKSACPPETSSLKHPKIHGKALLRGFSKRSLGTVRVFVRKVFKCSSIFFMVCWSEYYGLFPHINMTSTWQMSQLGRHEWDRPRRGFGAGILEPNEPLNDGVSHGAPNTRRFGETVVFPSIPWIYFRKSSCFHLGCSFKKGTSHKVAFYREQKLMLCTARAKQKCEGSECQGCSMIPHWFSVLSSMQKPKSPIDFCRVNSPSQIPVDSRT